MLTSRSSRPGLLAAIVRYSLREPNKELRKLPGIRPTVDRETGQVDPGLPHCDGEVSGVPCSVPRGNTVQLRPTNLCRDERLVALPAISPSDGEGE